MAIPVTTTIMGMGMGMGMSIAGKPSRLRQAMRKLRPTPAAA